MRVESPRLAVEQRLLALLALLGLVHVGLSSLWMLLALAPTQRAELGDAQLLTAHVLIPLTAIVACVIHVALRLPALRWPRSGFGSTARGPSVWPLTLIGAPALLAWPILLIRDRRARTNPLEQPNEIELGFRQLLDIPRVAAARFASWLGAGTILGVAWSSQAAGIEPQTLTTWILVSLASLVPLISLAATRMRSMLVPEYLSAPRPDPLVLPHQRSLALRLGGPAGLALAGAVLVPLLAGQLWYERVASVDGSSTAQHDVGLEDPNSEQTRVVAAQPPRAWLVGLALGLTAGFAALTLLLRDLEREVGRASRQVGAVAEGDIPEPMVVGTFATAELRALVAAVDRLVGRITDANVATYVLIEKGQEADRLKSQFLANMSHDLRSPLNSVIGFSDLLMTGIEGELTGPQRERVTHIHQTGKDLLQQIDDILDTAKIEAGRMELHREPTPPATLISKAIQRVRAGMHHPIEFETVFAPGLPPAFVDPYRTVQALANVLLFALEGVQSGTIEITCDAVAQSQPGREVVIRIVSPRSAVPVAQLEQARRGFFRLPGHTGLGLGLPIATSILSLQNGELVIEDGTASSLGGRAALAIELRVPALSARRVPRTRNL